MSNAHQATAPSVPHSRSRTRSIAVRTPVAAEAGMVTTLAMMRAPRPEPSGPPLDAPLRVAGQQRHGQEDSDEQQREDRGTTVMAKGPGPLKRPK
jgi:hypothetical protein